MTECIVVKCLGQFITGYALQFSMFLFMDMVVHVTLQSDFRSLAYTCQKVVCTPHRYCLRISLKLQDTSPEFFTFFTVSGDLDPFSRSQKKAAVK